MQEIIPNAETTNKAENAPDSWINYYPVSKPDDHKYSRGHTLILSGSATNTGAARLMVTAALRIGSGLVTLASPQDAVIINASHLTSVMLREADTPTEVCDILSDPHFNCVGLGPGMPADQHTIEMVEAILQQERTTVLDAGALSCFADCPERLFYAIKNRNAQTIITPHEGEFTRLFHYESCYPDKCDRALKGAKLSGAYVVLKGPKTTVASPDGKILVTNNAPPWLATAGSGDVLAGIIAGLLAQKMPVFEAANAAVWMHGEAANILGPGMISSDLDQGLQQAIRSLVLRY